MISVGAKKRMGSKVIFLFLMSCGLAVAAQTAAPADPTVGFTLDFPGSIPGRYSITVASSGKASYTSGPSSASGPSGANASSSATTKTSASDDSDDPSSDSETVSNAASQETFHYEFTVSEGTRRRIFDLAERAHYFDGNLDYNKHKLANTGSKTLTYQDGRVNHHSTYNYTTNQPAQQLTVLFQNMSATLEFGRRLSDDYRHQKLALEQELKRMEEMAKGNNLEELQAVSPILKQILSDKSVINVTRARAERLLALAASGSRRER